MISAPDRKPASLRGSGYRPTFLGDTTIHQQSTLRRQTRILMDVHPGLQWRAVGCGNHSFTALPWMNNLHSFDN